jgi:hypothetical protein
LGADYDDSPYTQTGERVQRLAIAGVRLVIEEFRSDVTQTRKDGSRGRLRVSYGDPKDAQAAVKWLWRFVDAAKTPGELFGRALVVIAAEQHAARLVLPSCQRTHATRWGSHKELAVKALRSSPDRTSLRRSRSSSRPSSAPTARTPRPSVPTTRRNEPRARTGPRWPRWSERATSRWARTSSTSSPTPTPSRARAASRTAGAGALIRRMVAP